MKRPGSQERRPDTVSVCDLLNPFDGTGVLKKEICGRTVFTGRRPLTKIGDGRIASLFGRMFSGIDTASG